MATEETTLGVEPTTYKPTVSNDDVDITLIRWMLTLSPAERLKTLQKNVESILKLRHAKSKR